MSTNPQFIRRSGCYLMLACRHLVYCVALESFFNTERPRDVDKVVREATTERRTFTLILHIVEEYTLTLIHVKCQRLNDELWSFED